MQWCGTSCMNSLITQLGMCPCGLCPVASCSTRIKFGSRNNALTVRLYCGDATASATAVQLLPQLRRLPPEGNCRATALATAVQPLLQLPRLPVQATAVQLPGNCCATTLATATVVSSGNRQRNCLATAVQLPSNRPATAPIATGSCRQLQGDYKAVTRQLSPHPVCRVRKLLGVHRKACTQEQDFGGRSSVTTLHAPKPR